MVFIKMLQTKTAINASHAMQNDFIYPKFLFKSNTMQPYLSNYTIPRAVQLKTVVLHCRRNARFLVHTRPPRKFSEFVACFLILPGCGVKSRAKRSLFINTVKVRSGDLRRH